MKLSTFTKNLANAQNGGNGGAIAYAVTNIPNSGLLLDLDSFYGNQATGSGGAVFTKVSVNSGTITVSITNSTFANNTAGSGGGVDIFHYTSGDASASAGFVNDTFYTNSAGNGGGIAFDDLTNDGTGQNTAALTSLTVYNNQARVLGGGVFIANGSVEVTNNIFDGNKVTAANYTGPLDVSLANPSNATLMNRGFNLVGISDEVDGFNDGDILDNSNDPRLNPLAANGAPPGYPQTMAPEENSAAIGNGSPALIGTTDERGKTRQDPVSIGAEDPTESSTRKDTLCYWTCV